MAADIDESKAEDFGECGEDLSWYFSNGMLVIRGIGDIIANPWMGKHMDFRSIFLESSRMAEVTTPWIDEHHADIRLAVIEDGCKSICHNAFRKCENLSQVILPRTLKTIGNGAFEYCSNLIGVTIPDSVTEIGNEAFHGCSSLTRVTISESVTKIGNCAFLGCSSLTSVAIPVGVTEISTNAFRDCGSLTSITIPNPDVSIALSSFDTDTKVTIAGREIIWDNKEKGRAKPHKKTIS